MLTGLGKPPSPSDAVDLLLECHVRIRHFVAMARRLGEASDTDEVEIADTAARVVRYFRDALPLHVRDEEDSLAPRLRGRDPAVDAAVAAMEREHGEHRASLEALVSATAAIAEDPGRHEELSGEVKRAADDLARQFEYHLAEEEAVVLPAVRRLLDAETDAAIVREMRERRVGVAAEAASAGELGSLTMKDSARRTWGIDVRQDGRGRYLQFRPIGIDIERFRASADGHLPGEWLPIEPDAWTAFARVVEAERLGAAGLGDLAAHARRLLDRMVREAQHRGLVFDEDED